MKKISILFLALVMIILPLFACASDDVISGENGLETNEKMTDAPITVIDYLESLPEKNFNGDEIRILGVDYETRRNFPDLEENGEPVNDALFLRNRNAEEKYNFKVINTSKGDPNEVTGIIQKAVLANDQEYHVIISTISGTMTTLSLGKCLYDMLDMPYIQLDENWWSKEVYNNLKLGGKLYFTLSDFAPMKFYAPYVMCYNMKLADDYGLENIYDLVLDGNWTLDHLTVMTKGISHDLDGDGVINQKDFHAYAHVKTAITTYSHYVGAGLKLYELDSEGWPIVNLDNDKSIKVIEKISSFLGDIQYSDMAETYAMFEEGRALFFGNSTSNVIATFRTMEDDFGIIPVPKYDAGQEQYYSYINTSVRGGVAVPRTCADTEMTGFLLEVLSYMSYSSVRDALFETTMKQKVARDDTSGIILDMIFDSLYVDLNGIYNFGGSANILYKTVMEGAEFASSYAAVIDKIETDIVKTIEQFQ